MADELTTNPVEENAAADNLPQTIRAFDAEGREVQVPREEWATQVLPNMIQEQWDQPDNLYAIVLNSLNDGFVTEMTGAAERLYQTDPLPARGVCMWSIVLMQTGRLDEAEPVMTDYLAKHGDDGSVLVNLARLHSLRGDNEKAEATLWHSLEVEPNLDNGLGWFASIAGQRGGAEGARQALERVAAMPASWRAQLWIAREELQAGKLDAAKALYAEALNRASRPLALDFLMQMSGDLGGGGHLLDLIALTAPEYDPALHGMPVGNNLIKAYVDTGSLDAADQLRRALQAQNRPDWRDALMFWDNEIGRQRGGNASLGQSSQAQQQIQLGMLRVDGPVWLPPQSPARSIFGAKAAGPSVSFLGGTAEGPEDQATAERQAEAIGRLTRSLPLYFAEQVEMRTAAVGRAVIPWAVAQDPGQRSGFVVSGARWPDEVAIQMVSDPANRTDYVVSVHVDAEVEPWTAELAFLRTEDGTRIGELQAEFPADDFAAGLDGLAVEVVELLSALGPAVANAAYQPPQGKLLGEYMQRLEQLLTLRCATMDGATPMPPEGQRAMLAGETRLCEQAPASVPARLLLVETLGALTRLSPEVAGTFQGEFQRVMLEYPLAAVDGVFAGR